MENKRGRKTIPQEDKAKCTIFRFSQETLDKLDFIRNNFSLNRSAMIAYMIKKNIGKTQDFSMRIIKEYNNGNPPKYISKKFKLSDEYVLDVILKYRMSGGI